MRRQSKPFVTEYRTPVRRHAGPLQAGSSGDGRAGTGEGGEGRTSRFAADELFRAKPAATRSDEAVGSYRAAMRAADALFSVRRPEPAATPDASNPMSDAKSSTKGRILEVVEQVEAPAEPVIEAAPAPVDAAPVPVVAPARRGRKPGSKNKPKPIDVGAADVGGVEPEHVAADAAFDTVHEDLAPVLELTAHLRRKRREPFSWVRTQLAPGERWKRRLPKVAW